MNSNLNYERPATVCNQNAFKCGPISCKAFKHVKLFRHVQATFPFLNLWSKRITVTRLARIFAVNPHFHLCRPVCKWAE